MFGKDRRTLKEIEAAIRKFPRVIDEATEVDLATCGALARDFAKMRLEDYVPRGVLDGPDGTGALRASPTSSIPDWEQKFWQRKYAVTFQANGRMHFDVNDAWDDAWDHNHPFDLVRALRVSLAKRAHEREIARIGGDVGNPPVAAVPTVAAGEGGDNAE